MSDISKYRAMKFCKLCSEENKRNGLYGVNSFERHIMEFNRNFYNSQAMEAFELINVIHKDETLNKCLDCDYKTSHISDFVRKEFKIE